MRGESERSDLRAWLRPFWVRLCLYLAFYLGVGPVLFSAWDSDTSWDEQLRQGFFVFLFVVPGIELPTLHPPWPFWVRLCFYLAFYLGEVPLFFRTWIVDSWGVALRPGLIAVLFVAPCVESFMWRDRLRAWARPVSRG